ncbi:FecR family protein [Sphingomonas sp.]|uniref:FecR family protein n=1 Tax=Sphingomonas sp. TaxID=28214 RepID=UPI0025D0068F|nr:FecR domain-containing protein [Sphingomonas sp.]
MDWLMGPERFEPTPAHYEAAIGWLMRLREAEKDTNPAFEEWKRQHPAHEFAFAEAEAMFAASAGPAQEASSHYHRRWNLPGQTRSRRWIGYAIAASLLLALAPPTMQWIRYLGVDEVTGAGAMRKIRLADGSLVTLNSRTAFDFTINRMGRSARLVDGEAYFEIAHDSNRPFTIRAGDATVRVLGTKFNIRLNDAQSVVSVTEGHVRVTPAGKPAAAVVLGAGQEAVVANGKLQQLPADALINDSWRQHRIVFRRTPLRQVVAELNRYRGTPIYLMSNTLGDRIVTAVFATDDPEGAVRIIDRTLGARSVTLPTGHTFLY